MKLYVGILEGDNWGTARVEVLETSLTGVDKSPLEHHVRHSPTGFSWGYAGSGPAELARCILIDHLGTCRGCNGTGKQVWRFPTEGESVEDAVMAFDPNADYDALTNAGNPHDVGRCSVCDGDGTAVSPSLYQAFKFDRIARLPVGPWQISSIEIDEWLAVHGR